MTVQDLTYNKNHIIKRIKYQNADVVKTTKLMVVQLESFDDKKPTKKNINKLTDQAIETWFDNYYEPSVNLVTDDPNEVYRNKMRKNLK